MAKTKSQRMKEYRARKKALLGKAWLDKETDRVKKYYVPTNKLGRKQKAVRRQRIQRNAENFRLRRRTTTESTPSTSEINLQSGRPTLVIEDENCVSSTSTTDIPASSSMTPLTVKLPCQSSYSSSGKKKTERALAKAYRELHKTTETIKTLNRKLKTTQKKLGRKQTSNNTKTNVDTPRRKTNRLMKNSGLSPKRSHPSIRKKLLFAECVIGEVKRAQIANPNKKNIISRVVSGRILKRCKLLTFIKKNTGLTWRHINASNDKVLIERKKIRQRQETVKKVQTFFERDDNSRLMPGKSDAVKVKPGTNGKVQKRILNDYLYNLFLKFTTESDEILGYSTFCKYRPKHTLLVNFTSRNTCLCSKHQNFALKLKCIKSFGIISSISPDKFVDKYRDDGIDCLLNKISVEVVNYQEWKKVAMPNGKERLKIVDSSVPREEFISTVRKSFASFIEHVDKVVTQYSALRNMKESLPVNHVIIHMDFAENYSCQNMEEIQSAYWSTCMVTLHPTIVYYRDEEQKLSHKSLVFVSDVMQHNSSMVHAIITRLMLLVKDICPTVTNIHFWTDSPTSQYRNKSIFDIISRFKRIYDIVASWLYFEAGHGKGACDGIGGTAKRNADMAVKLGTATIQDATDFYAWATSDSKSTIQYIFINQEEFDVSKLIVETRSKSMKAIKGTMMIHSVLGTLDDGIIFTRSTSCACNQCLQDAGFNTNSPCGYYRKSLLPLPSKATPEQSDYQSTSIIRKADEAQPTTAITQPTTTTTQHATAQPTTVTTQPTTATAQPTTAITQPTTTTTQHATAQPTTVTTQPTTATTQPTTATNFKVNNYVVALYDDVKYIGRIVDMDDGEFEISFMERSGKLGLTFKWPLREDRIWIQSNNILFTIDEPQPTGKTKRLFSIPNIISDQL